MNPLTTRGPARRQPPLYSLMEGMTMLIFDKFPTRQAADDFAADVARDFQLKTEVYDDSEEAFAADPGSYNLTAPVVHVERCDDEDPILERVEVFGGEFVGT